MADRRGTPLLRPTFSLRRPAISRQPPLINSPGVKATEGVAIGPKSFGENVPLRDQMPIAVEIDGPTSTTRVIQSPVFNAVVGAMAIQAGIDQFERFATCVPPR